MSAADVTRRSQALVKSIRPMLAGKGSEVQGAALCDLCAIWLAGHHPDQRNEVLANFLKALVRLTVINESIMFGDGGFPKDPLQ
jgi:hypothetical protein